MSGKLIGFYPGSFDPMTMGHYDVVRRASLMFDEVIIGIGINQGKPPLFSVEERVKMMEQALSRFPGVRIISFEGLAVDAARKAGAAVLIRGLRTEADFTYEMQMAMMNRTLETGLETIFLPTSQEYSHISSTLVKEVALLGGKVQPLVPPIVFKKLSEKKIEMKRRVKR